MSQKPTHGDVLLHFLSSLEMNEKLMKEIWSALNIRLFCSVLKDVIGIYCSFDYIQLALKNLICVCV